MKDATKIFLIRSWTIGMAVVVVHYLMGLQHLFIGIFLGIVNTFFIDYYIETIKLGNRGEMPNGKKLLQKLALNLLISIMLCLTIRLIDYGLLKAQIVETGIEPFRFILSYQIIYYSIKAIISRIVKNHKKKVVPNE
ncbi:MAG TPA: hypothetical protein GXZ57_01810 [Acholeplasmataceae bacterium]|nr:hypothetical protein [Acholeplasmataceae bacterium]